MSATSASAVATTRMLWSLAVAGSVSLAPTRWTKSLRPATLNAVAAAAELAKAGAGDIHVLVAGEDCRPAADTAAKTTGVAKVLIADGNYPASSTLGPRAELVSLNLAPGIVACSQVLEALLSAIPVPDPEIENKRQRIILEGDVPSPVNPPSGCPFHPRCWKAQAVCREQTPVLENKEGNHQAACFFPG